MGEGIAIGAFARGGWERSVMGGRIVAHGAKGEMGEPCAGKEKTCGGGKAMQAASLMALDARVA